MWGNLRGRGKAYRKIWCKGSEEGAKEGTHPGRYHKAESVEEGERTQETGKVELHNRRQLDHSHVPELKERNGLTDDLKNKIDIFFATGRITEKQYNELMDINKEEEPKAENN